MATTRGIREITLNETQLSSYEKEENDEVSIIYLLPRLVQVHSDSEEPAVPTPTGERHDSNVIDKLKSQMNRSGSEVSLSPFNFINKYTAKKYSATHLVQFD
jgi:hypothetical protein